MDRNKRKKGSKKIGSPDKVANNELVLTKDLMDAFIAQKEKENCASASVAAYRSTLQALYRWLPTDKILNADTISKWSAYLHEKYAQRTANLKLSTLNSLLDYAEQFEMLHLSRQNLIARADIAAADSEALSREDYLQLLRAAKANKSYRIYLVVKVIAITGIPLDVLPELTVDAVDEGIIQTHRGNFILPHAIKDELLRYIQIRGVEKGVVFTNTHGKPMPRTTLISQLKSLGEKAEIDPRKVSYGALAKMHDQTMQGIWDQLEKQATEAYDKLLEKEAEIINWW